MSNFISLWQAAVTFGTVILFGALGELITEKSGNLNLGTPGVMYFGGIASLIGAFFYESNASQPNPVIGVLVALICALVASGLAGLLFCFLTTTLRANQNVTGLTLTILGSGVANFFGGQPEQAGRRRGPDQRGHHQRRIPGRVSPVQPGVVGKLLFSYGFLTYVAILLAILASLFLNRTRKGLNLRAVGESPATADATGINVTAYKYLSTCVGSAITGLGGVFYTMNYIKGTWANDGTIEGLGWLALALVIFASWKSLNVIWGSYLFGILYWLYFYIGGLTRYSQELFKNAPLCGHHPGAGHHQRPQQEGEQGPRGPGPQLLPGGALTAAQGKTHPCPVPAGRVEFFPHTPRFSSGPGRALDEIFMKIWINYHKIQKLQLLFLGGIDKINSEYNRKGFLTWEERRTCLIRRSSPTTRPLISSRPWTRQLPGGGFQNQPDKRYDTRITWPSLI